MTWPLGVVRSTFQDPASGYPWRPEVQGPQEAIFAQEHPALLTDFPVAGP